MLRGCKDVRSEETDGCAKERGKRATTRITKAVHSVAVGVKAQTTNLEFSVTNDERYIDEGVFQSRYFLHELVFATAMCQFQPFETVRVYSFNRLSTLVPEHTTVVATSQARLGDRIIASRSLAADLLAGLIVKLKSFTDRGSGPFKSR